MNMTIVVIINAEIFFILQSFLSRVFVPLVYSNSIDFISIFLLCFFDLPSLFLSNKKGGQEKLIS